MSSCARSILVGPPAATRHSLNSSGRQIVRSLAGKRTRPLGDRNRLRRSQGPTRRRRSPQPNPTRSRAHRSVRLPLPRDRDPLVHAARRPPARRQPPPQDRPLVPPETSARLRRHARRATPRTHPRRISTRVAEPTNPTKNRRPRHHPARTRSLKSRNSSVPTSAILRSVERSVTRAKWLARAKRFLRGGTRAVARLPRRTRDAAADPEMHSIERSRCRRRARPLGWPAD